MKIGKIGIVAILMLCINANAQNIQLVHDAFTGDCGGYPCGISPHSLSSLNGKMYYTGYSHGTSGDPRLWSYNGIDVPTLVPGSPNNYINEIKAFDSILIFSGRHNNQTELWRYNGITGPEQITTFNQTGAFISLTDIREFVSLRQEIYFKANVTDSSDVWSYNSVTRQIENLCPNTVMNSPSAIAVFNDSLFFRPTLNPNSVFAYAGYGTCNPRPDFQPPLAASANLFGVYNNALLYVVNNASLNKELWRYNADGSHEFIYEFLPPVTSTPSLQRTFTEFQGKLYFIGDLGEGLELLVYDGQNSPVMVADIYPGLESSQIQELIVYNDKLFFTANDGVNGLELYSYNGVTPPQLYEDFYPGSIGAAPANFNVYNGDLYFSAENPIYGSELHRISEEASLVENDLENVSMYPNPSEGEFFFKGLKSYDNSIRVNVYSLNGQLHSQSSIGMNENTLRIEANPGLYLVKIQNSKGANKVFRVVIK